VIFLPDYLDGKKETNSDAFVDFPRSTTNLSASEPDAFPADKVAEATRRNVVIESSGESDAERTSTGSANQSANDGAAKKDTGVNAAADARVNDSSSTSVQGSVQSNAAKPALEKAAEPASTDISAPVSKPAAKPSSQVSSKPSSQPSSGAGSKPSSQTLPALPPKAAQVKTALQDSGWVVQLGVFRNKKNVNELQTKLEKAGYRAFSREVDTAAGRLTKVFVGPELERNKLDKALNHLYEISGAKGKVTSFEEATK
jgi:DedD protein